MRRTPRKMKHVFVINPCAGKCDATDSIRRQVDELGTAFDCEIYVTKAPGDATRFVRQRCLEMPSESFRFYACGGDGTINEVVSGIVDLPNAEMTCYPSGSGNDYVKYFGTQADFLDLKSLANGTAKAVDVMRVVVEKTPGTMGDSTHYSLNICNFGFDAIVCKTMEQVRRKWLIGGRNAYTTGIVKSLLTGRRTQCRITVDGNVVHDGEMLLCTLGNGRYVGGAYQCSPLSQNDDGLVEVCLFKPLTLFRFIKLIGSYRDGTFIHRPDIQDKMTYLQGRVIDIDTPRPIDLCVDGEMLFGSRFHIEQLQRAIRFAVPQLPTHQ